MSISFQLMLYRGILGFARNFDTVFDLEQNSKSHKKNEIATKDLVAVEMNGVINRCRS